MTPVLVISIILFYFIALISIAHFTSKKTTSKTFYTGDRKSPWYLVAFGMTGASLSGVTFISVPGETGNTACTYLIFVLGNAIGYLLISKYLLPLYYKLKLVSIYTYLKERFGLSSYKTGAAFFLVSQTIGASFRLFLVACALQIAFFDAAGLPFSATVAITILLIWVYTYKGGIKTIVFTDTLQTLFMLLAVITTIFIIANSLDLSFTGMVNTIATHPYAKAIEWDWHSSRHFLKLFTAGIAITIVMNGLDQNIMQKNLTCKNTKESQRNMHWFTLSFVLTNILFLGLGILLYKYAEVNHIDLPKQTDEIYAFLALNHFGLAAGILFLLGITAAAYSSADSALTALTTSFCIDILGLDINNVDTKRKKTYIHVGFSILMFIVIVLFKTINNESVVTSIFKIAGYTYGPLLGLYAFGMFTKREVNDKFIPLVCILSPILSYLININSVDWLNGYHFGFELLILNGLICFIGLWVIRKR